jgi:hypothetical protein
MPPHSQTPPLQKEKRLRCRYNFSAHLQMVLQVAPDTRELVPRRDAVWGQLRCDTHSRQQQQLGRTHRPRAQDHLTPNPPISSAP